MPLYTRTGDDGHTSLGDGTRVPKTSLRVEAYGTVDEACCAVGLARAAVSDPPLQSDLRFLQQRLMSCASVLASPARAALMDAATSHAPTITAADVAALEAAIDRWAELDGPWRGFVLPSGCEAAVRLHFARAVTRRAERRVDALAAAEPVPAHVSAFLNRASDLLFATARAANEIEDADEEPWDPAANTP